MNEPLSVQCVQKKHLSSADESSHLKEEWLGELNTTNYGDHHSLY